LKAVVVQLNNTKAAVLSDDGCITTIKNNNYEIGQVIQLKKSKTDMVKKLTVMAAAAAGFIFVSVGSWAYASPYTYVSVDVNPSIEFIVNRFDRVIKVKAVNDDGEDVLSKLSLDTLKNQPIDDAITTTVDQISATGYFDGDTDGGIMITTSSEDAGKAEALAVNLQESVEQQTVQNGDVVEVEAISVGKDRVQEAQKLGVTPGKLNLVEQLQEAADDPTDISIEEWLNKPVKDIMKATKDYKDSGKSSEDTDKPAAEDTNNAVDTNKEDSSNQNNSNNIDNQKKDDQKTKQTEKAAEKANKDAAKAEEKAQAAQEKADKKAQESALEKDTTAKQTAKAEAEQAKTEAKEAKKAAKEAKKAAKEAQNAAAEAQKKADKAKKDGNTEKKTNSTEDEIANTGNPSSDGSPKDQQPAAVTVAPEQITKNSNDDANPPADEVQDKDNGNKNSDKGNLQNPDNSSSQDNSVTKDQPSDNKDNGNGKDDSYDNGNSNGKNKN